MALNLQALPTRFSEAIVDHLEPLKNTLREVQERRAVLAAEQSELSQAEATLTALLRQAGLIEAPPKNGKKGTTATAGQKAVPSPAAVDKTRAWIKQQGDREFFQGEAVEALGIHSSVMSTVFRALRDGDEIRMTGRNPTNRAHMYRLIKGGKNAS